MQSDESADGAGDGKGVNRTILAIAKPLVDFKRSDTLWLMRLFDAIGVTAFSPLAN